MAKDSEFGWEICIICGYNLNLIPLNNNGSICAGCASELFASVAASSRLEGVIRRMGPRLRNLTDVIYKIEEGKYATEE